MNSIEKHISPEGYFFWYTVSQDPFTKETSLVWKNVGGDTTSYGFRMGTQYGCEYRWTFAFAISGNSPVIEFSYYHKIRISKASKLILLFDDDSILTFPLNNGVPGKGFTTKVIIPIYDEEANYFTHKLVKMIRVQITEKVVYTDKFWETDEKSPRLLQSYANFYVAHVLPECCIVIPSKKKVEEVTVSNESGGLEQMQNKACSVYLMVDTTNGYHKIGISNKPQYREKTLQSEKPTIEMLIAKEFPSRQIARAFEASLHKVYESKHLRGEWFDLSDADVSEVIQALK